MVSDKGSLRDMTFFIRSKTFPKKHKISEPPYGKNFKKVIKTDFLKNGTGFVKLRNRTTPLRVWRSVIICIIVFIL